MLISPSFVGKPVPAIPANICFRKQSAHLCTDPEATAIPAGCQGQGSCLCGELGTIGNFVIGNG